MRTELDPGQLGLTVLSLYKLKEGEVASAVLHVGHKLGLFTALDEAGPTTSVAFAETTGLHERWLREFLFLLSALDLAQHDDGEFMLTPEASVVLAQPDHPNYQAGVFGPPITQHEIDRTIEAFSSGIGMTWDEHGAETCHFQAAMGAGGQKAYLVPVILDSIDAMTERLRAGATVVDIGCGAGVAFGFTTPSNTNGAAAAAAAPAAVAGKLFPEDAARTTVRAKAIDSGKAAKIARLEAEGNNRKAKVSGSGGSKLAKKAKPAPGGGGIGKGKATAKVKSKAAAKASKGGKRK